MTCSEADTACGAMLNASVTRMSAISDFMLFMNLSVLNIDSYSRLFINWWLLFLLELLTQRLRFLRIAG
jgi:hypothetical protein